MAADDSDEVSQVVAVALDCHDVELMAAFWCAALGTTVTRRWSDARGTGYVELELVGAGQVLLLQPQRVCPS